MKAQHARVLANSTLRVPLLAGGLLALVAAWPHLDHPTADVILTLLLAVLLIAKIGPLSFAPAQLLPSTIRAVILQVWSDATHAALLFGIAGGTAVAVFEHQPQRWIGAVVATAAGTISVRVAIRGATSDDAYAAMLLLALILMMYGSLGASYCHSDFRMLSILCLSIGAAMLCAFAVDFARHRWSRRM